MRLEALPEYQLVIGRIVREAQDSNDFAADAPSMERKEYYRGMRDGLRRALAIPEEILNNEEGSTEDE